MIVHGLAKLSAGKVLGIGLVSGSVFVALGLLFWWELWDCNKNIQEIKNDKNFSDNKALIESLEKEIESLLIDNAQLSRRQAEIERQLEKLKKSGFSHAFTSISSLINEGANPTNDSSKLGMLKWVMDDNVKLRESIT